MREEQASVVGMVIHALMLLGTICALFYVVHLERRIVALESHVAALEDTAGSLQSIINTQAAMLKLTPFSGPLTCNDGACDHIIDRQNSVVTPVVH